MKPILLIGLADVEQWQCAHDAIRHAHSNHKVTLTYGVDDAPDIVLTVTETDDFIAVQSGK